MKIATWNVERLKHRHSLDEIISVCNNVQADILILTETDLQITPDFQYCFHTPLLAEVDAAFYKATENKVSIFTNYPCVQQHTAYDKYTSLCVELETEMGNLLVYGTIIGIYGNRHPSFMEDLNKQMLDLHRLANEGKRLCFSGDFNCSFSDNYYFTKSGRTLLTTSLEQENLKILTRHQKECIDHIAVSREFLSTEDFQVKEWNLDKRLSDHKGIAVAF